ncbi:MAG TPA: carboxypeptidase regulatory-like domain-containing protein [Pyrinomonadaceae bacterium]|jgi:carboxypeptidase family protein|nr:carboxypeptidase regulatory-like domain-containing protein [Pyrinomonadaceae bacterium]
MHTINSIVKLVCCGLLLFVIAETANAQFKAGLQGTITDTSGALVPQAKVTLVNNETGKTQETTSSDEGFYRLSGLAPGKYKLTIEKTGYKQKILDEVAVSAEAVQGIDVTLDAGDISATVTVTQETEQTLQTENANVDKGITTTEVRALPQFGRDPYELTRLTPGVFGDAARSGTGGSISLPNTAGPGGSNRSIFQTENQPQISANGQRITSNNYQIDGTSVNSLTNGGAAVITPNQESVKEVRVIASAYSAEYGRNSGAQVLVVSQNGTNDFHGSLFLKNNSPGLNAFNKYGGPNGAAPIRVNQHLNQFGGSIGGPLHLPRFGEGGRAYWNGKNRAFFFMSYEGLRSSNTDTVNAFVETPEFRQLVIGARPGSIAAQILSAQGIGPRIIGVIPVSCTFAGFNAGNCTQLATGLDIGGLQGAQGQYISFSNLNGTRDGIPDIQFAQLSVPTSSRGNQFNPRIDINLSDKDTLTFGSYVTHFTGSGGDAAGRSRPMGDIFTAPRNLFGMVTWNRTISATLLNEARFNATRFAFNEIDSSSSTNFGIPRIEIETYPFDRIRFGAPWAETTPGIFAENTFEFRDTVRWAHGNQGWSFGGEIRKEQDNNDLSGGSRPLYTFAGLFNFANDAPLFYQINADPRTGGPAQSKRAFRSATYAFFGQNDWKLRPNLMVNLGLRWEYFTPPSEKNGILSNLVLGPPGQELTGASLVTVDRLFPPDKNNFAPRLGFAYSPDFGESFHGLLSQDKMVIRGGAGIIYNRIPLLEYNNTRGNPPFFARYAICCGTSSSDFSTPFNGGEILYALGANNSPFSYPANPALRMTFNANGIPTNLPPGSGVEIWGAPAEVPTTYVYTYSLDTQYSLPHKMVGSLGYQGSAGRRLVRLVNERFFFTDPGIFSNILFPTPDTNSSYNAMIARLTRRYARGFQFDAIYRWSKSLDIVSYEGPTAATNPTYPLDVRQERGPSDYDVRHHFVASGLWDLPIFRHRHDAVGNILGGWEVSGIVTAHTGFPWTPVVGNCISTRGPSLCPVRPVSYFGGAGTDTSNDAFITGSNFPGGGTAFFSTAAPVGFQLPGIGRNSFRGPRYFNIDMTLSKKFGIFGEGRFFEVKANFFNIFNILNLQPFNFNSPSTQVTNSLFGRAEKGLAGRVVELQGRIQF